MNMGYLTQLLIYTTSSLCLVDIFDTQINLDSIMGVKAKENPKKATNTKPQVKITPEKPSNGKSKGVGTVSSNLKKISSTSSASISSSSSLKLDSTKSVNLNKLKNDYDTVIKVSFNDDGIKSQPLVRVVKSEEDFQNLLSLLKKKKQPENDGIAKDVLKKFKLETGYELKDKEGFEHKILEPTNAPKEFWSDIEGKNGKERVLFKVKTVTVIEEQKTISPPLETNNVNDTDKKKGDINVSSEEEKKIKNPIPVSPSVKTPINSTSSITNNSKSVIKSTMSLTNSINSSKSEVKEISSTVKKENSETPNIFNFKRLTEDLSGENTETVPKSININMDFETKKNSNKDLSTKDSVENSKKEEITSETNKSLTEKIFGDKEEKEKKEKEKQEQEIIQKELEKKAKQVSEKKKATENEKPEISISSPDNDISGKIHKERTIEILLTVSTRKNEDSPSSESVKETLNTITQSKSERLSIPKADSEALKTVSASKNLDMVTKEKSEKNKVLIAPVKESIKKNQLNDIITSENELAKSVFSEIKNSEQYKEPVYVKGDFSAGLKGEKKYKFLGYIQNLMNENLIN